MTKLADLDQAQASTRALHATDLTVGGIVKHLAWVEDRWFQERLLGAEPPEPWASAPMAEDPDWPFHSSDQDSVEALISLYSSASARVAPRPLDSIPSTQSLRFPHSARAP